MSEEFNKFPYRYSQFVDKVNADWDGDPKGDYIMAEHINQIQDAIVAIEEYLGVNPDSTQTLKERLEFIQSNFNEAMPIVHSFLPDNENNPAFNESNYQQADLLIVPEINNDNSFYKNKNLQSPEKIFGIVNSQLPLNTFQTKVGEWLEINVGGIFLQDFGLVDSLLKQSYLDSIYEHGLKVIIQTHDINQLNESNLKLKENTYVWLEKFGYDNGYRPLADYDNSFNFLIQELKNKDYHLIGQSDINSQTQFSYVQKLAYLYALDGLYIGPSIGKERFYQYDYSPPLVNWKLAKGEPLNINYQDSQLSRTTSNGSIYILPDGIAYYKGRTYNSSDITWHNNTIPGTSLTEGSIPPGKLSSYDVEKIINLINDSHSELQIDITKIRMDEIDALPANIPAANMQTNVVLAINRSSDPLSTNNSFIDGQLIHTIDARKIVGTLSPALYEKGLIHAINANNDETENFLDIKRLDVNNINLRGTLSGAAEISSNTMNTNQMTVDGLLTAVNTTITGKHSAQDGEYETLYAHQLRVDELIGLKDLVVENLQADNINTLVLEAIEAQISSGVFNQIVTKALTAETIQTDLIVALNSITDKSITNSGLFGEAIISDASIIGLNANKINSGTIDTGQVDLSSPDGHLRIQDKTIKIYDNEDDQKNRRLKVLLGDASDSGIDSIDNLNLGYGLLVLGNDGTTRLYDHTGVYNAGIHENAISEEKLQDDSISSRVIQTGAVIADHIQAGSIVGDHIGAEEIDGTKILAGTIEAGHIDTNAIEARHIKVGQIDGTKIISDAIEGKHIKAGSITADKLTIGFQSNLINNNYDSFELLPLGAIAGRVLLNAGMRAEISNQWSSHGSKSLRISGNHATTNNITLTPYEDNEYEYHISAWPNQRYGISAYVYTFSTLPVRVRIGLRHNGSSTPIYLPYTNLTNNMRSHRISGIITLPDDATRIAMVLDVGTANTEVYFDRLQIEEIEDENIVEVGTWKPTATTQISGEAITTGQIGAQYIKIGTGTRFGNGNIITITDAGIKAESVSGSAMLNSKGLEVTGGAISIQGGSLNNTVSLDGNTGITLNNARSRIVLDTNLGFNIYNKQSNQELFSIDANTGNLRIAGSATFAGDSGDLKVDNAVQKIQTSRRVFTSQPVPPYDVGDLWVQGGNEDLLYATRARTHTMDYQASDWEKATPYTDDSALKEFVKLNDKQQSIRLGMLMHYKDFNNQKVNSIYFCGIQREYENFGEELVDTNGSIYDFNQQIVIDVPKQTLDLETLEEGISGYLVFNYRDKQISFIYYDKEIEEMVNPDTGTVQKRTIQEGWFLFNHNSANHNSFISLGSEYFIIGELTR